MDKILEAMPPQYMILGMIFMSIAVTIAGTIYLILKFQKDKPDVYKADDDGKLYKVDGMKDLEDKVKDIDDNVKEILLRMKIDKEG